METISFVIPCLNEEKNLPSVLEKINNLKKAFLKNLNLEIIVSDNGSTDNSMIVAKKYGAKVVQCPIKGYGAALKYGIKYSVGDVIIFADADNTYDFYESPMLINELSKGYDLVIGDRLKGNIQKNAMPFLHKYIGTPMLTFIINYLYSHDEIKIFDCNSGFRCFKRNSFYLWGIKSDGMEFASEMLVKALKSNSKISHVPISLYPDSKDRKPHLKTWTDGMRHLLQIFTETPVFFFRVGILLVLFSWMILILSLFTGPVTIYKFSIFGLHTMMFTLLGSYLGITILSIGLLLSINNDKSVEFYKYLINLQENKVFWSSVLLFTFGLISLLLIIIKWGLSGFIQLSLERETLVLVTFGVDFIQIVFILITAHLMKRILK